MRIVRTGLYAWTEAITCREKLYQVITVFSCYCLSVTRSRCFTFLIFRLDRKVVSRSLPKAFLNGPLISVQDVTFWHFVKCFLNKHELERYHVLKHVHTDVGKGRAWLRSSLNEHSLERYLCNMLDDVQHFRAQFYADHALLRFESSNRQLIEIAKNLSEILFAINIDNIELDHEPKAKVSGPRSPASEPLPIIMNRSGITSDDCNFSGGLLDKSKRRPRKTLRGNLITFQDCSEDVSPRLSSSLKNDSYMDSHSAPNTPLMRNRMHLDLNVSTISPDSPESGFRFSDRKIEPSSCKPLTRCDTEPSGRLRRLADDERSDEELHIMQNPIPQNVLLTPITTDHCCSLIDSFAPAGEEDNEKLSCSSQTVTNSEDAISGEQDNLSLQMSSQDQAQMEFDQRFRQEVELITKKVQNKLIRLELQNETLQKENDSLKAQLKKYIDAVQMLKPDGAQMIDQHAGNRAGLQRKLSIIEQLSQVMSNTKTDDESSAAEATTESTLGDQSPDFSHFEQNEGLNKKAYFRYRDAIEYERKLIQVAEMHGELVEFNDRLHRILMQKDAAIKRLKDELIELRGPVGQCPNNKKA